MEFMYAAELKKRFTCYGHFYELLLMNGERAKCRSVLEIVDTSIPQGNPSAISEMEPDVVVIMMNIIVNYFQMMNVTMLNIRASILNLDVRRK